MTVAEMAMASGIGADLDLSSMAIAAHAMLFGEDQARYVVTTVNAQAILDAAEAEGIPAIVLGTTGGTTLKVGDLGAISVSELKTAHENWLPDFMAAGH